MFFYKCNNYYIKASEDGVMYNDSDLNIGWGLKTVDILLSDRNTKSKTFMEFVKLNGLTK